MKKFISALSMVAVCCGFIVSNSFADDYVQSGLIGESSDDVCAWTSYTKTTFTSNCKEINKDCKQSGNGAGLDGVCKKFNDDSLRCVARQCPNGYVMPLVFSDKRDVFMGQNARILGYCYSKAEATKKCEGNCAGGGTCEPKFVSYEEANTMLISTSVVQMTGGEAFVGCFCKDCDVPQGTVCESGECEFIGEVTINCDNGQSGSFPVQFRINKNDGRKEIAARIEQDNANKIKEICKTTAVQSVAFSDGSAGAQGASSVQASSNAGKVGSGSSDSKAIGAARDRLAEFFKKVDSDRSVWKNADGSFNATRLASDLTAGVVLGTVGGVVSGVLIKKSQVEKGFDALNCTVGGQKIADWGDEFSVGLRR